MRAEGRSVAAAVTRAFTTAGRERDLAVQSMKAAGAAIVAWAISGWWLQDPMGMMAPWVAILLVQGTVFRSVLKGVQQLGAIAIGTLFGAGAMMLTGNTLTALALVLPAMMLLSTWSWFGDQGIAGPTTALLTLTSGPVSDTSVGHRLLQSALGAAIGIAVNALVLPPVHLRDVRESLCTLAHDTADTLDAVAERLGEEEWDAKAVADWRHRVHGLEGRLDNLRSARQWSGESMRMNPKWRKRLHRDAPHVPPEDVDGHWVAVVGSVDALVRILVDVAGEDRRTPAPTLGALREYGTLLSRLAAASRAQGDLLNRSEVRQRATERDDALDEAAQREAALHEKLASPGGSLSSIAALGTLLIQARAIRAEICHDTADRSEEDGDEGTRSAAGYREDTAENTAVNTAENTGEGTGQHVGASTGEDTAPGPAADDDGRAAAVGRARDPRKRVP
ncbi:FUSC family protein [Streptomyces meridianus]|uniref:Aromatic acid exporter family protein n=1 Tax=Streptomyces meridianus TaxID=2938945 RepID=A0ABT0X347_9ACTN|nr:aromatic acid exporter family protein [Streptomyces meridianus]MCM2576869.1 aromatic acid exporter family protein [Streptomyces meridianus]